MNQARSEALAAMALDDVEEIRDILEIKLEALRNRLTSLKQMEDHSAKLKTNILSQILDIRRQIHREAIGSN